MAEVETDERCNEESGADDRVLFVHPEGKVKVRLKGEDYCRLESDPERLGLLGCAEMVARHCMRLRLPTDRSRCAHALQSVGWQRLIWRRDWIKPARVPWVAFEQPANRQPETAHGAVGANGVGCVRCARRMKTAAAPRTAYDRQNRRKRVPVKPDQAEQAARGEGGEPLRREPAYFMETRRPRRVQGDALLGVTHLSLAPVAGRRR